MRWRVWDLPTRLVHWGWVGLFAFSWWSAETHRMEWHRWSGYAVLTLLLFRLYWGFAGGSTARFADFVRGPRAFLAYLKTLHQRPGLVSAGHNPMGGWSVLLLLALLLLQTGSGLFAVDTDGIESGPLARYVSFGTGRDLAGLHELSFDLLLAAVGLHLAAIAFYGLYKRENLVAAMLSGRKTFLDQPSRTLQTVPAWRAVLGVLVAAGIVALIARGFAF